MERGPAAKAVTEPEARRADRRPGQPSPVADGWSLAVRPPVPRPFDGPTGGRGNRDRLECLLWVQNAKTSQ
jgi:hypothetical protein